MPDPQKQRDLKRERYDLQDDLQEQTVRKRMQDAQDASGNKPQRNAFPVVGIGASAGGLEAFERFFTGLPENSGIAFVLVQHLDPTHESMLADLLSCYTNMRVQQVRDGMRIEPDNVYVIPPNRDMGLLNGHLHLMEPAAPRGFRLPIDFLFRSMADDQTENAICIVLSGTGTDGTLGLKAVKGAGGMTMTQDPEDAKYDGMPRSAIDNEVVDFVLPAAEMPRQLMTYVRHAASVDGRTLLNKAQNNVLDKIFLLLRDQTGHDFSGYKPNTIRRRIERRMAVNQIDRIGQYVQYLQRNPLEVETLFREMLIGVTSFFRDDDVFEVLEFRLIPRLFEETYTDEPLRIWIPGCSTGEEAYSIAILLHEYMRRAEVSRDVQIFATDIDNRAIERARQGTYPDNIAADVLPQRLERYFTRIDDNGYQVNKVVRDSVVFAVQNIIKDPPFSRMNLISCRNLLIYLDSSLQKKVLPLFHYALKDDGFLLLGTSETLGEFSRIFETIDRKSKLYKRLNVPQEQRTLPTFTDVSKEYSKSDGDSRETLQPKNLIEDILLQEYTPTSILIEQNGTILYAHGRTGKYLELSSGTPNINVLRMAREGLHMPLTTAIYRAVTQRQIIEYDHVPVRTNGDTELVRLTVRPIQDNPTNNLLLLIMLEVLPAKQYTAGASPTSDKMDDRDQRIVELDQELQSTREYLQTTIEELETANEELKSTNEELQSSNEELQSTNEELETAKEELQSVNEELMTVNAELQQKIDELSRSNNDMNNLLASVGIAIVFLDMHLHIKRFNPMASKLVNLIETDIGRPLQHITPNVDYTQLVDDAKSVLDDLVPIEKEVELTDGRWYWMRVRPYRTVDNEIDGVVITFADITQQKQAQHTLLTLSGAIEQSVNAFVVMDVDGVIEYVNPAFVSLSGYTVHDAVGHTISELLAADTSKREEMLQGIWQDVQSGNVWRGELQLRHKDGTLYWISASFCPVTNADGDVINYISIHENIGVRKSLEAEVIYRENLYRNLVAHFPDAAVLVFDHDLRYIIVDGEALEDAGYKKAELEGNTLYDVLSEDAAQRLEPLYRKTLQGQETEQNYTSTNGQPFKLRAVPLRDQEGQIIAGMIVATKNVQDDDA